MLVRLRFALAVLIVLAAANPVVAQDRPAAGVVQRGAQPNPGEVGPGNRDGDAPSAAAGELMPRPARRILGLPVDAALIIAGLLVVLALFAGVVIPGARRRDRARGGGTYGGDGRRG